MIGCTWMSFAIFGGNWTDRYDGRATAIRAVCMWITSRRLLAFYRNLVSVLLQLWIHSKATITRHVRTKTLCTTTLSKRKPYALHMPTLTSLLQQMLYRSLNVLPLQEICGNVVVKDPVHFKRVAALSLEVINMCVQNPSCSRTE